MRNKTSKNRHFYLKIHDFALPTVYGVPSARMSGPLKSSKNDGETPGFWTPKTTKNGAFSVLLDPP